MSLASLMRDKVNVLKADGTKYEGGFDPIGPDTFSRLGL